jgi:NADH-quinone oxidoreductase subunit G
LDGEPYLQATARSPEVRLSPQTAEAAGITSTAMISNDRGSITLPAVLDPEMIEGVVWLPSRAPGQGIPQHLAATAGDLVTIGPATETVISYDDTVRDVTADVDAADEDTGHDESGASQ